MIRAPYRLVSMAVLAITIILASAGCSAPSTPTSDLPDLKISAVQITLENAGCYDGSPMGTRVTVVNNGPGAASRFEIQINSSSLPIEGLAGGESTSVWAPGTLSPPNIVVDPANNISESDEGNNTFDGLIPIPTLPLPCATATALSDG